MRFDLRAPDGSALVAHVGPEDDLPLLRPGDKVWACWEPESARFLRRRGSTSRSARTRKPKRSKTLKPATTRSHR